MINTMTSDPDSMGVTVTFKSLAQSRPTELIGVIASDTTHAAVVTSSTSIDSGSDKENQEGSLSVYRSASHGCGENPTG
jgi:hypothetical protein